MAKLGSKLAAEAIGVFGLSFVGIMAIHQANMGGSGLVGVALAHGLILSVMITAAGAISGGHINPAVTVGLMVLGKIKPGEAAAYIVAQCAGGMLAGLAVIALMTNGTGIVAGGTPVVGVNTAGPVISLGGAVIAEAICTFFLMSAVLGTAVDPRAPKIGGFGIGLTVTADILAIGPLTGAAMNPARAFGPALAATLGGAGGSVKWGQHWIYWVAPILGAVAAAVVYKVFFAPEVMEG